MIGTTNIQTPYPTIIANKNIESYIKAVYGEILPKTIIIKKIKAIINIAIQNDPNACTTKSSHKSIILRSRPPSPPFKASH